MQARKEFEECEELKQVFDEEKEEEFFRPTPPEETLDERYARLYGARPKETTNDQTLGQPTCQSGLEQKDLLVGDEQNERQLINQKQPLNEDAALIQFSSRSTTPQNLGQTTGDGFQIDEWLARKRQEELYDERLSNQGNGNQNIPGMGEMAFEKPPQQQVVETKLAA